MTSSVYIHIPFCSNICTYCTFTKFYYNQDLVKKYLKSLKQEILSNYKGELIKTLYIGGGTPSSLTIEELQELFSIIKIFNLDNSLEFTFECNPENLTISKLKLFKENKVNRISLGIQSTLKKNLTYLGRNHNLTLIKEKIKLIKKIGINNINVDLIYALNNQTLKDLEKDLNNILNLDITHISTYSLEIYPHTILGIKKEKAIDEELDFKMYELIKNKLKENGFIHYEISNFSKRNYKSLHNLVYWNNENYYGFGVHASGYLNNLRYTNTSSLKKYLSGDLEVTKENLNTKDILSYALILGFRKIDGINKKDFYDKYHVNLIDLYNIKDLIKKGLLEENSSNIYISYGKIYIQNSILINFIGN